MMIRRLVGEVLAGEPLIDVVGEAGNGRIALQKIGQLNPDLVTLDIEMPELDGLATLREIRKKYPRLPVIMFSALTERGAADTLEALHNGASDYLTKPSGTAGKDAAQQRIRQDLVPKIKSLCRLVAPIDAAAAKRDVVASSAPKPMVVRPVGPPTTAAVVAIGLSTGGPTALSEILSHLPGNFPAPVVLVQHMPHMFTRFLAERLNGQTPLAVVEATDGQALQSGAVYVAPGDFHLTVRRVNGQVVTGLNQEPPQNSHRPASDVLFRSVADAYGARALAVVLTGMGQDGLRGSEDITRAGGRVLAQDEATSVVWETPGLVVRAGLADAVLPLRDIAGELRRRATPVERHAGRAQ